MTLGQLIVTKAAFEDIESVYGKEIFKILKAKKVEGYEIVFVDEFGNSRCGFDPVDLR